MAKWCEAEDRSKEQKDSLLEAMRTFLRENYPGLPAGVVTGDDSDMHENLLPLLLQVVQKEVLLEREECAKRIERFQTGRDGKITEFGEAMAETIRMRTPTAK